MRVQVHLLLILITGSAAETVWGVARARPQRPVKKQAQTVRPAPGSVAKASPAMSVSRSNGVASSQSARKQAGKAVPASSRKRAVRSKARKTAAPRFEPYVVQNWPAEALERIPTAWIETPPAPPPPQNCRVCETWLLASAYEQIGIRYRRGGANPKTGFDCSGLMRYLFERNFQISLPPTAPQQFQTGLRVEKWELEPGDLVFFRTRRGWHVGLYVGNDFFLHAPNRRKTVRVSPLFADDYWRRAYVGSRRIPLPEPVEAVVSDDLSANND